MNSSRFKTAVVIASCLLVLLCCTQIASAEEVYGYTQEAKEYMGEFEDEIETFVKIFRTVASAGATVSVAIGAFKMLLSMWGIGGKDGEKELAKAKRLIVYSLVALASLMFLEPAIKIGMNIGQKYGWKPTNMRAISAWITGGWWLNA